MTSGKAVFSMRDLVFLGFFCGPFGLGFALWQSLNRVGEPRQGLAATKGYLIAFWLFVQIGLAAVFLALFFLKNVFS